MSALKAVKSAGKKRGSVDDMQQVLLQKVQPGDLMAAIEMASSYGGKESSVERISNQIMLSHSAEQSGSRPDSSSSSLSAESCENDELVQRLEVQGKRKKELSLLIGQLHSMMDDEPVDQLKKKLKEMEQVKSENERMKEELDEFSDKILQIEADSAQQVQSVLDTNERLQKELVKLSRDLSNAETALSDEKKNCKERLWSAEESVRKMTGEMDVLKITAEQKSEQADRLSLKLQDEQKNKDMIVEKFKRLSFQLDDMTEENESLKTEKVNVSTHLWNLTEKLKDISGRLEQTSAESAAATAEKAQLERELEECKTQLTKKSESCRHLETDLMQTQKQLISTTNENQSLESNFKALSTQCGQKIDTLSTENTELRSTLAQATSHLEAAKHSLVDLESKVGESEAMRKKIVEQTNIVTACRTDNARMKMDVAEARKLLQSSTERASHLEKTGDVLRANAKALDSRCAASEAERDALFSALEELKGVHDGVMVNLEKVETERTDIAEKLKKSLAEAKVLQEKHEAASKKLEVKTEEFENATITMQERITFIEEELAVTQGQRDGYMEEMELLKSALEEGERSLSESRHQIAQHNLDLETQGRALAEKVERVNVLEGDKTRMRETIAMIEGEKRDMIVELKGREKEFNSVQQEVSELQTKLESRLKEKAENEERLMDELKLMVGKYDEAQLQVKNLEPEIERMRASMREATEEVRDTKQQLKQSMKESAINSISFNSKFEELEKQLSAKKSELEDALEKMSEQRREIGETDATNRKLQIDIKQSQDNLESMERRLREQLADSNDQLVKARQQTDKVMESASVLEQRNQALQEEVEDIEGQNTVVQGQLAAESDARRRIASELERERTKAQRVAQQHEIDLDNGRQDILSVRRRAEESEKLVCDLRKRNDSLYEEFDKAKIDLRKQMDTILDAQANEESRAQRDMEELSELLAKAQEDLKSEEQNSAELRREIDNLKLDIDGNNMSLTKANRKEAELREEFSALENQLARCRQDRNSDSSRLEEKLAALRKEKLESSKDMEKMRLKLRATNREVDELRRQLHSLRAEEEWKRQEMARVQEGASDQLSTKEKEMNEALRQEEEKRKESERQAYQHHASTVQEIEQLRRRNQDLAESVQSLTHALQTLTGSGEKRGTKHKAERKSKLKRSRNETSNVQAKINANPSGACNAKESDENLPSDISEGEAEKRSKVKSMPGKDTARRSDITEALRKRGWRQSDDENKLSIPANVGLNDENGGQNSPVMSHTSASKIRKLARQDSNSNIGGIAKRTRSRGGSAPSGAGGNELPAVGRGGGSR